MKDIHTKIVESFEKNRFSVLATLISQSGSAPRSTGTKFIIMEDGSSVGTIGGGRLEALVIEEAKKVFETHRPIRFAQFLRGTDVAGTDMLCGGDVEIFLEPVSPNNLNHLQIFKKIIDVLRRGGSGLLATVVDTEQWQARNIPKMFINSNGERTGSLLGIQEVEDAIAERMDPLLRERQPTTIMCHDAMGKQLNVFVEPVISDPVLYIFGGGHVSMQVVPLAHLVGFKVVVIDDRPEFTDPERFPDADEVHNYSFEGVMDKLAVNESSYLVIITRGHAHDKTVLAQSLKTPAGYIGMIGSRRKISIIYKNLMEEGFTREDMDRVFSPIGIEIGAETPEEIAVSIIAELIRVRAGA